jgi:chromosome partitioning protein
MRVLSLVSSKGGTGKSTLCVNISVAAEQAGERVFVVDLDPQGSALAWGGRRQADTPGMDRCEPSRLPQALADLATAGYTLAVLDTAGVDVPGAAVAMKHSGLTLVPARPSVLDIEAARPTMQSVIRLGLDQKFAFALNAAPPGRSSSRRDEAGKALNLLGPVAEPPIGQRVTFLDAMSLGLGVTEHESDGPAAAEIRQLWAWISKRMN